MRETASCKKTHNAGARGKTRLLMSLLWAGAKSIYAYAFWPAH